MDLPTTQPEFPNAIHVQQVSRVRGSAEQLPVRTFHQLRLPANAREELDVLDERGEENDESVSWADLRGRRHVQRGLPRGRGLRIETQFQSRLRFQRMAVMKLAICP